MDDGFGASPVPSTEQPEQSDTKSKSAEPFANLQSNTTTLGEASSSTKLSVYDSASGDDESDNDTQYLISDTVPNKENESQPQTQYGSIQAEHKRLRDSSSISTSYDDNGNVT